MKIEVKNVSKKFKDVEIIKPFSYTFESGRIYGLCGRNGSGKSVFLKLLAGYYVPSEGEILYDGVNLNAKLEFPKNLRALIESPSFFPDMTGYENLKMLADIQGKIGKEEILDALTKVNLIIICYLFITKTGSGNDGCHCFFIYLIRTVAKMLIRVLTLKQKYANIQHR